MLYSAKLVFTIRSLEVFALRGDLLYIFYESCSWEFLVRGNSLVRGFVFRGSTVVANHCLNSEESTGTQ